MLGQARAEELYETPRRFEQTGALRKVTALLDRGVSTTL